MLAFLFGHGYVFLTDMVCGPQNWCASPTLQRAVLSLILPFAFGSMLLLARRRSFPMRWALAAGALYALNPYMYERLLAGQWRVAMGYAVFPALVALVSEGWKRRDARLLALFSTGLGLLALISPHWGYMGVAFLLLYGGVFVVMRGFPTPMDGRRSVWHRWEFLVGAVLVPFFVVYGCGSSLGSPTGVGGVVWGVTENDFRAFATVGDPTYGVWGNVVNLYGFWQQDLLLPKDFFTPWFLIGPLLLLLSLIGMGTRARVGGKLAITTFLALPVAFVIAVGYGSPLGEAVTGFLAANVAGFAGLRETHKVAGIIAFAYALYAPVGVRFLLERWTMGKKSEATQGMQDGAMVAGERGGARGVICASLLVVLALVWSNGLLGDFHGQVRSGEYPASWDEAAQRLQQEKATGLLVLPWEAYVRLPWVQGRMVANPVNAFFPMPIHSSGRSNETYHLWSETAPLDQVVYRLVQGFSTLQDERAALSGAGVSHVLLLMTEDAERYVAFLPEEACPRSLVTADILLCRPK